jgi:biotin carboxyl carrier protein
MKLSARLGGMEKSVEIEPIAGAAHRWRIIVDGAERTIDAHRLGPSAWSLLLGDQVLTVDVDPGKDGELLCEVRGVVVPVRVVDEQKRMLEKAQAAQQAMPKGPLVIESNMPGKVVKVLVKPGEAVAANQPLIVVEAMKMENEVRAPRAGAVTVVHVRDGQTIDAQGALVTIE